MYRLTLSIVRSGRMASGEKADPDAHQNGRFGFWYWHWVPWFHYNGGRFRRREVLDLIIGWLCFSVAITAWPSRR